MESITERELTAKTLPLTRRPAASIGLQASLLAVLIAITTAVFCGVSTHEFVHWDDSVNIYANPNVSSLDWPHLKWMFTNTSYARRYMPLGWLCYAIDRQLFGLRPHLWHVINLIFHLANVLLLFFAMKRI